MSDQSQETSIVPAVCLTVAERERKETAKALEQIRVMEAELATMEMDMNALIETQKKSQAEINSLREKLADTIVARDKALSENETLRRTIKIVGEAT